MILCRKNTINKWFSCCGKIFWKKKIFFFKYIINNSQCFKGNQYIVGRVFYSALNITYNIFFLFGGIHDIPVIELNFRKIHHRHLILS